MLLARLGSLYDEAQSATLAKVMGRDLTERLLLLENAVLTAGCAMLDTLSSSQPVRVWRKADQSLLMNVDLESQERLLKSLEGVAPIVSEEDPSTHSLIEGKGEYLIVDPLDGTTSCKRFMAQEGGQLGFGPLVGYAENGIIQAAAFFNLPRRAIFSAYRGGGAHFSPIRDRRIDRSARTRLQPAFPEHLEDAAILFYPGSAGELSLIDYLRSRDMVENAYRFGGFANDCSRLASGYEQAHVQLSVHPWDYSAVLIVTEAGLSACVDPLGTPTPSEQWVIKAKNPVLLAPPALLPALLTSFRACRELVP